MTGAGAEIIEFPKWRTQADAAARYKLWLKSKDRSELSRQSRAACELFDLYLRMKRDSLAPQTPGPRREALRRKLAEFEAVAFKGRPAPF